MAATTQTKKFHNDLTTKEVNSPGQENSEQGSGN
jgi:hypothetical protein